MPLPSPKIILAPPALVKSFYMHPKNGTSNAAHTTPSKATSRKQTDAILQDLHEATKEDEERKKSLRRHASGNGSPIVEEVYDEDRSGRELPSSTPSPHHRASLTQKLIKRFSFASLLGGGGADPKHGDGVTHPHDGGGSSTQTSPKRTHHTTTSDQRMLQERQERFNKLHQWTPDQLLRHHYRDEENSLWVKWYHDDLDEDEDDNPQNDNLQQILSQASHKHPNVELYLKQNSPSHFFVLVYKKQVAYNDECEISHEVWSIDRILDEEEWLNVNMRLKEWKEGCKGGSNTSQTERGAKIGALLKLVQQENNFRNQYAPSANSAQNASKKRASLIGSLGQSAQLAQFSSLKAFKSYLEVYHPTHFKSISNKISSFNQNFIILRGADLGFIARKVDAFHQRFQQDTLREMRLTSTDSSTDHDMNGMLYEDEEDEEYVSMENYLNCLTRSMIESDMYDKIFNGVWKTHFEDANKRFFNVCQKLRHYNLTQLGLEDDDLELFTCDQNEAVNLFRRIDSCHSSYDKLMCVKMCTDCVSWTVENHQASVYQQRKMLRKKIPSSIEPLTSDQLIPIFTQIILLACPNMMESNLSYMDMLKSESFAIAELGYALVTLSASVEHAKRLAEEMDQKAQEDDKKALRQMHNVSQNGQECTPREQRRKSRPSFRTDSTLLNQPPSDFSIQENRRSSMHLAKGTRGNFIDNLLSDDDDSDDSSLDSD
uniref:VPS9 domain-containing protein n=1 Tax=Percolomonas cosmopolitus TaxID=63605 RepID=A0A7S1KSB1_9EUKA|mmetsp:Transcript_7360/g.27513  ORF Transcript_7360/g.27513 Transcript_7360/m.27513 type:complete len:715 (+) Transcript_7360:289-2433(+)